MIGVGEALRLTLDAAPQLGTERILLDAALGRVAAEAVYSPRAVPGFDNSAMDGFAVRAADVTGPGVQLRVVGSQPAGSVADLRLQPGTAVRVFTGSLLPDAADAVVKVEDTTTQGDTVTVHAAVRAGTNVRRAGEDIAPGAVVVSPGTTLGAADLGLLASVGRASVVVYRRPRVAIVPTGAELVELDVAPGRGQVVNSNAYALAAAVRLAGGEPTVLPIVGDAPAELRARLEEAARADLVLSSGGVSVGDCDFVKEALDAIGVARVFWKVAQKPGKPLTVGRRGDCLFVGLPGNPVSALVCFWVYVWPALRRMGGHRRVHLPAVDAVLTAEVPKAKALTEFLRVHLEIEPAGGWRAVPFAAQGSAVLSSLGGGAALLVGPASERLLRAGNPYRVLVPMAETVLASAASPLAPEGDAC